MVEINEDLVDNPRLLNEDALAHWIIKVEITEVIDESALMTEEQYLASLK